MRPTLRPLPSLAAAALVACSLSAPASAQPKPANALGAAIVKATESGALKKRVLNKRVWDVSLGGRDRFLATVEGTLVEGALKLTIKYENLFSDKNMGDMSYVFDKKGKLVRFEAEERGRQTVLEFREGKLTMTRFREGKQRGEPQSEAHGAERVPMILMVWLAASLHDQGLPLPFACQSAIEFEVRPGRKWKGTTLSRDKSADVAGKTLGFRCGIEGKPEDYWGVQVASSGPDEGKIVRCDLRNNKRVMLTAAPISADKVKALMAERPLLVAENKAQRALRTIYYGQQSYKRAEKRAGRAETFAGSIEELAPSLYDESLKKGENETYLFLLHRSPAGKSYIAVAAPKEPGKSGRWYYAQTQDGKVYRSKNEIPLEDDCKVPADAEAVPR